MPGSPESEARVPPHDLPAERAALYSVMVDCGDPATMRPSALETVIDLLHPEHFYSEAHRRMFEAIVELFKVGKPIDSVGVATWLRKQDRLAQVGGMSYIAQVLGMGVAADLQKVRAHAQTIVDTHLVRQTIFAAQLIVARGYGAYGDAREFVIGAADTFLKLSERASSSSTTEHVRGILTRTVKEITAAQQSNRGVVGAPSGIAAYDRLTSGFHQGDLTIVAARPGMGKTSFVTGILKSIAAGDPDRGIAPQGALILSMEMPREQLANRMMCSEGSVDVARLRGGNGGLSQADWSRLIPAATKVAGLPIWIDDQSGLSLLDVRAKVRWCQQEAARTILLDAMGEPLRDANGEPVRLALGVVAVDYLQLMEQPGESREQAISAISRGLKAMAKDLKLPVIALSQLNRNNEGRTDKRPQLSDLRESGAIEQDADNICFIYRDFVYSKDEAKRLVAELIQAKQRNGSTDTVLARFDDRFTRFSDIPDSSYADDPNRRAGN